MNDDAAVLEIGGETLVLTQDSMVEGVHFLPGQDAADVAWKLVATNMSDLAAKGAEPIGVLVGYQLGTNDLRFASGLKDALASYGATLLGGDTVGGDGPQTVSLTALGRATHCPVPSRATAQPGDGVWITGPVGAALLGFEALRDGVGSSLAYCRPRALLREGRALAPLVSAMMDVSDGLLLDAWRMATASGVTISIDRNAVPIATADARRDEALRWGDDYQLLFTAPAQTEFPVSVHRIGTVQRQGPSALFVDSKQMNGPAGLGYQHG